MEYDYAGELGEIRKVQLQDVIDYHEKYYHPSNALIYSFGN